MSVLTIKTLDYMNDNQAVIQSVQKPCTRCTKELGENTQM